MLHRRSIFLINKPFQFRYSLYVCSWIFALSLVYPTIIYQTFEILVRYAARDPEGPPVQFLLDKRHELIWMLGFLQILFMGLIFLISIFMSHRIAGPVFKLTRAMDEAAEGKLPPGDLTFRKRDHFPEMAESFNRVLNRLRPTIGQPNPAAKKAIQSLELALSKSDGHAKAEIENALKEIRTL